MKRFILSSLSSLSSFVGGLILTVVIHYIFRKLNIL